MDASTPSTRVAPALCAFLRHAASTSPAHTSSSSSPLPSQPELLAALQQTIGQIQAASPDALAQIKEQLLPLLAVGASALSPIWKQAFESKAAEPSGFSYSHEVQTKVHLALASARLLRNLVVGDEQAQGVVFDALCGDTLGLLRLGSSLAFSSDPELQPLVRTLVQMMSNVVTMNKPLQKALFVKLGLVKPTTCETPEQRHQMDRASAEKVTVLQNLLGSPDAGIAEAVQILLLNCIKASATNSSALAVSAGGRGLLGQLLMLFEAAVEGDRAGDDDDDDDDDDFAALDARNDDRDDDFGVGDLDVGDDDGDTAQDHGTAAYRSPAKAKANKRPTTPKTSRTPSGEKITVTIGHAIFAHLFEIGLFRHIYRNLGPRKAADAASTPLVTTEQTLLLKTVDAWINAGGQNHPMHEVSSIDQFGVLLDEVRRLSDFVRIAISQGPSSADTFDRRLPSAYQALVLVLENLIQLGMIGCEGLERDEQFKEESEGILRRMRQDEFVDEVVALLRAVTEYQPPISPFVSNAASSGPLPAGHAATSTGLASSSPQGSFRFENLARAIIQLVGVLVFQHSPTSLPQSFKERPQWENKDEAAQIRHVQDRVREQQGLLFVLGATRLDEANPYIREHAIFTLRYLLQGNDDNQDVIRQLRPISSDEMHAS